MCHCAVTSLPCCGAANMPIHPTCGNRGEFTNQELRFVLGDATIRAKLPTGWVMGWPLAAHARRLTRRVEGWQMWRWWLDALIGCRQETLGFMVRAFLRVSLHTDSVVVLRCG